MAARTARHPLRSICSATSRVESLEHKHHATCGVVMRQPLTHTCPTHGGTMFPHASTTRALLSSVHSALQRRAQPAAPDPNTTRPVDHILCATPAHRRPCGLFVAVHVTPFTGAALVHALALSLHPTHGGCSRAKLRAENDHGGGMELITRLCMVQEHMQLAFKQEQWPTHARMHGCRRHAR